MTEEKKERTIKVELEIPESAIFSLIRWDPDEGHIEELEDIPYDICVQIRNILIKKIRKALFPEEE